MNQKKEKLFIFKTNVKLSFFICFFFCVFGFIIHADGAYIPFTGDIIAYEPSQSAVIGWDGYKEVLILSTNVRSGNKAAGWAIELIPFPSLPSEPSAGTLDTFSAFSDLFESKIGTKRVGDVNVDQTIDIVDALLVALYYVGLKPSGFYKYTADVNGDGNIDIIDALLLAQYYVGLMNGFTGGRIDEVHVEFSDRIGIHNLTVVQTENPAQLISFAEQVLSEVTVTDDVQWNDFQVIAEDYINRGITYWVIDLLDLTSTVKSRDPLIYTFETSSLYFPLRVSSVNSGNTLIDIITITKNKLEREAIEAAGFEGIPIDTYFEIIGPELIGTNDEIANLFAIFSSPLWISRHYYQGALKDLDTDLIVQER
ncbi:MAG: hypothetical protein JXJ04_12035 [Spirochaetales bacterium]|nr:hypothetical protein [Spirochaetales bacterium]